MIVVSLIILALTYDLFLAPVSKFRVVDWSRLENFLS